MPALKEQENLWEEKDKNRLFPYSCAAHYTANFIIALNAENKQISYADHSRHTKKYRRSNQ